jgi:hypothetical protein
MGARPVSRPHLSYGDKMKTEDIYNGEKDDTIWGG